MRSSSPNILVQRTPFLLQWAGKRNASVYALDWLGMGRSARVPFLIKAKKNDVEARVQEAESFFVESLEDWRKQVGLEKMTLVGHSLGAYLSVVYALRYPTRVSKLILLSPAGVPRDPDNSLPSREIVDIQEDVKMEGRATQPSKAQLKEMKNAMSRKVRDESRMRKLFTYLWEEGWSPFQVVRSSLFWGPMLIGKVGAAVTGYFGLTDAIPQYSSRRFSNLTAEDMRDMHDYILNITLAKGSGEYCISHLLAPGAHARMPLIDRIDKLKVPVTFACECHVYTPCGAPSHHSPRWRS